jgi:hypothetical protein
MNQGVQMKTKTIVLAAALSLAPGLAYAQFDFHFDGRDIQFHSFASQGFAYSNDNNYLTMKTSQGSLALTDFGFNVSTQVTDKFHVGAQFYDRNIGLLGKWHPEVDWAYGDYWFTRWFGVRGGKVKTVLGLFNDTQDMEFLHTWALMPQSVYPIDVRGDTISHIGGDLYGNIPVRKLGDLSYTFYGGLRPNDPDGGYLYGLSNQTRVVVPGGFIYVPATTPKIIDYYGGPVAGADLRWNTPINGLLLGASYMKADITTTGIYKTSVTVPYKMITLTDPTYAFYVDYSIGKLRFNGEYRREIKDSVFDNPAGVLIAGNEDARSGYVAVTYRLLKWLAVGTYHSRFIANWGLNHGDPENHIFDQTVTGRFDINKSVDFKLEGHFINGCMVNTALDRGFYIGPPNPNGLKPTMNMLVARLSFHM